MKTVHSAAASVSGPKPALEFHVRQYYPASLKVEGRKCVVVGTGRVGLRKARALVKCGARVIVIGRHEREDATAIHDVGLVELKEGSYTASDLEGAFVVVAATDEGEFNRLVARDARAAGALVNVVDDPEHGDFIAPATVRRGGLALSVSTGGASPTLASKIRRRLEDDFGPEYSTLVDLLRRIRPLVLDSNLDEVTRRRLFDYYTNEQFVKLVRDMPTEMMFEEMKSLLELAQEQASNDSQK